MGDLVETLRHLWLTLANLPDRKSAPLFDAPSTPLPWLGLQSMP